MLLGRLSLKLLKSRILPVRAAQNLGDTAFAVSGGDRRMAKTEQL